MMRKNNYHNYTYKILLDPDRDAWNWYDACNDDIKHGVNWSKDVPEDLLAKVKGKPENVAFDIISEFLKQRYIDEEHKINQFIKFINKRYKECFADACIKLEEVMDKPLYRNSFTTYITTYPAAPNNYKEGYMLDYIGWDDPISGFMHELSHIQFFHYWRSNPDSDVSKLTEDQYEWLKESLTIILDEDMLPLIERIDKGYNIHQPFRQKLHKFWKVNHDFDKLVDYGIKLLPDFIIKS